MLTTTDEAESDLRRESHKNWKLITPTQVKHYKRNMVVAMCLDQSCRQLAYFVPVDAMAKQDIFEAALAVAIKRNTGFMPVIQCNLDRFPEVHLPTIYFNNMFIYLTFKATGNLALQPMGHRHPVTYSLGKVRSLKLSAFATVSHYLSSPEWETKVSLDTNTGNIVLSLVHKGTNQSATVSLKIDGDEVTGRVMFNNARFRYQRWNFSGSYGLQVTGRVLPREQPEPINSGMKMDDTTTRSLEHMVEVVLLVIGMGAVSVLAL